MFKSKIEVREFAITQAVEIMGKGTPDKDIVSKAKEIEKYVIGESDLPETSTGSEITDVMSMLSSAIGSLGYNREETANEPDKKKK